MSSHSGVWQPGGGRGSKHGPVTAGGPLCSYITPPGEAQGSPRGSQWLVFSWRTVPALPEPALGCTGCVLAAEMSHTRLYEGMASRGCVMMGTQSDSKQIRQLAAPAVTARSTFLQRCGARGCVSLHRSVCVCACVHSHTMHTQPHRHMHTPHTSYTPHITYVHNTHVTHHIQITTCAPHRSHTPHTLHTQHTHTIHIPHTHYTHNTHTLHTYPIHTTHTTHTYISGSPVGVAER